MKKLDSQEFKDALILKLSTGWKNQLNKESIKKETNISGYPKDEELKCIYVKRCKCGARPYFDRISIPNGGQWIACNCGRITDSGHTKQEAIDNWNNDKITY